MFFAVNTISKVVCAFTVGESDLPVDKSAFALCKYGSLAKFRPFNKHVWKAYTFKDYSGSADEAFLYYAVTIQGQ